ncbi:NAD(P)-dependent oxidoreductase [Cyanobium gracile]|uniref:Beta-hydroxyacid dehydrogenase, 3-hydroxyisobutyrate dehydrogenase n=1 Tax=Cyanobium gracile (strain ATCC 27147 / PCC 6307) TaxID=292564 RepID=K9PAL0_CYAGP|nr:NAD(P)-dependent oxidoreductase [Cyanobium gracile]AFY29776.1 beta-hydroxyacid dehydrogenase, 3-hydroxyisobutyrate dehydrogenase [Cyanobium gracile PCC 6307]
MEISLLGTGLLGAAIGERLLASGHRLTVWNRHPQRCAPLQALGATLAATPAEAVAASDVVITVLSDGPTTRAVLLEQAGVALAGRLVLQVATIAPQESWELVAALAERGAELLEVPVLGSRPEALAGTLQLMVGGNAAALERARPVLAALGAEPRLLGPVGAALSTKLALNQLIASLTHSFSLSLHLVQRAGVDVEAFMAILHASALYAPTFDKKLAKELADDYANPNFPTGHLRKDLLLFLQTARGLGLETEGLDGLAALLERATDAGLDELDYSALHRLTAGM